MRYKVHRLDISMTREQDKLEQYLNNLEGEIVAIIPNVFSWPVLYVDFVLIVEKIS
jgi:hypothetical protein